MKKVLVVGNIGREHALCWKLSQSPLVEKVFFSPGNDCIDGEKIKSIGIPVTDHTALIDFAKEHSIDLTVIGGDGPLAAGIVDDFINAELLVFGCTEIADRIENSKAFAKDLMQKNGIKTASYKTFTDLSVALRHVNNVVLPIVVKASGLALGKGVYICKTAKEAESALKEIMEDKKFGDSGSEVVIEEFIEGTELSIHAFCDGTDSIIFPPAQDHKAIYDGNRGPNTGGMGAVAPLSWVSEKDLIQIKVNVVETVMEALNDLRSPFAGLLFPGVIEKENEFYVLEYNARFGDPEAQCYMRLLESDLYEILLACAEGSLGSAEVKWSDKFVACVVLASEGYPNSYEKGKVITGIEEAEADSDVVVFHSGTKKDGEKIITNGGRVLSITAVADTLEEAIEKAYETTDKIQFEGKYMRTDIGQATLNK